MFLTLLYGLQSSSANRWWILASVKSFLEGLYSSSWRSIFQPASSWLQLGLEGERTRLHFYDGLPLQDRYCVSRRVHRSIEIQCRLIFGYAPWPGCIRILTPWWVMQAVIDTLRRFVTLQHITGHWHRMERYFASCPFHLTDVTGLLQ